MMPLPIWAQSDEARSLIKQLIAEHPDYFIRSGAWIEGGGVRIYKGKLAGQLRQMHSLWLEREDEALKAQYEVTGHWNDAAAKAVFGAEDANALIERILAEPAEQIVEVEGEWTEVRGDPLYRRVA